jgi:hypothetical protein
LKNGNRFTEFSEVHLVRLLFRHQSRVAVN